MLNQLHRRKNPIPTIPYVSFINCSGALTAHMSAVLITISVQVLTCFEARMHKDAPKIHGPNVERQLSKPCKLLDCQLHAFRT
jgi:hypothetical protein